MHDTNVITILLIILQVNLSSATLSSTELTTWWDNFELIVTSVTDPNALAEEACRVNLISADVRDVFTKCCHFGSIQDKTRSLLQAIERKMKGQSSVFHQFVAVLKILPGLSELASRLHSSYCRFMP